MTPYQRLQPRFDAYNKKIVEARNKKGWSLEQLSEKSGVSYSAISTQSANKAQNPKLFEQAAIAETLGLSLDELMGLHGSADTNELVAKIHTLELENVHLNDEVKHHTDMDKVKNTVIYALTGLCALLVVVVIGYMVFDAHILNAGLFQSAGMSVFAVLLVMVLLFALYAIFYAMRTVRKKK